MKTFVTYLFLFVLTIFCQVYLFDLIVLPGGFVISFYVFYVLVLPFNINKIFLMIVAFCLGMGVDYFNDTYGLNTSAAVFIAWLRPYVYRWFEPSIGYGENQTPTLANMGWNWIIKTYVLCLLAFNTWLYSLSFLRLIGPWFTAQKILLSTASTLLIILVVQVLYQRKAQKNEL